MALAAAVAVCLTAAWLGWCWVLVRREDVASRLTLAAAERRATDAADTVAAMRQELGARTADVLAIDKRLVDVEHRLHSTIARVGMGR